MDSNSNRDIGFEQRSGSLLNYQSSGICSVSQSEKIFRETASSIKTPSFSSVNTANSSFVSDRDQFISVAQNIGFKGHMTSQQQGILSPYTGGVIENQGNMGDRFGDLVCYPSDTRFFEQQPKLPCFGSEKFKEIVSPFATSVSFSDYHLSDHISTEGKRSIVASRKENGGGHNDEFSDQNLPSSGNPNMDHTLEELGGRKRNRIPRSNSKFDVVQSMEKDQSKVISHMSVEASKERDDKKQKNEQHPSPITTSKLTSKQAKGCSQNGDAPMDDCVHVRARRGQATNSHSLAERVRREKISERMKFLQELVPGCSKVTGKAVMLDEIINYVQSLQRQVEFLSMKLATVNPECKFDIIDQILTKDVIHSRFGPAISSRCPHLFEPLPGAIEPEMAIPGIETSGGFPASLNYQLPIMDQTSFLWDDELHGIVQMGFVSDTLNDLTKSGRKNG